MAENTKTKAKALENRKKLIAQFKKAFSSDNEILQFMRRKTPGQAIVDLLKPRPAKKPKVKPSMKQADAAKKRASLLGTSRRKPSVGLKQADATKKRASLLGISKGRTTGLTQAEAAEQRKGLLQTGRKKPVVGLPQKEAAKKRASVLQTSRKEPKLDFKAFKSIAAAKKAGSLYYMGKDGKKKIAVTKSDLDKSGLSLRDYINFMEGKTRKKPSKVSSSSPRRRFGGSVGMKAGMKAGMSKKKMKTGAIQFKDKKKRRL
jgi:hypothetical protein